MTTALIIIAAIILFLMVVLIHEFGHFITAKIFKVKVNEFSVGMGPKILSKQGKETKYSLRLLPIGGYCAMEGEDEASGDSRAFCNKKPWKKFIIVAAGAIFNIILGIIFMLIIQLHAAGNDELLGTTEVNKYFEINTATSAAYACGLRPGDEIVSVDGYKVLTYNDLWYGISFAQSPNVEMEILRDGQKMKLDMQFNTNKRYSPAVLGSDEFKKYAKDNDVDISTLSATDSTLLDEETVSIDFYMVGNKFTAGNVVTSALGETVSTCRVVYVSFWKLITGQFSMNDLSGPVGIVSYIGQAAQSGITEDASFAQNFWSAMINILKVMALITVNLGIFNLLPLPALDGGRLIFILIEAIRGKPVDPKYESIVHVIGLALLLALMVFVTYNDIIKLIGCNQ